MKKAFLLATQSNRAETAEVKAVGRLLSQAGFEVEMDIWRAVARRPQQPEWGTYDLIGTWPSYNGLFFSTATMGDTVGNMLEEARPGALALFICDTSLSIDSKVWNATKGLKPRSEDKLDYLKARPWKVIASFDRAIEGHPTAMSALHKKVLSRLHPESTTHYLQWLVAFADLVEEEFAEVKASSQYQERMRPTERFYWGIKKKSVVESLRGLGLGLHPQDAVAGSISELFPQVESVKDGTAKDPQAHAWLPVAEQARQILIPYDPLKSDLQLVKRYREAGLLAGGKASRLSWDPRIEAKYHPYILSKDPWLEKIAGVQDRFHEIF